MPSPKDPKKRKKWLKNLSKAMSDKKRKPFLQKTKDKMSKAKLGENHPLWKGKEYQIKNGRWYIWIDNIKYYRYRYVAEQCLGRKLVKGEVVHHINEDKGDDRPENLYLFSSQSKHTIYHRTIKPLPLISNI